jgi:hypothetical protein
MTPENPLMAMFGGQRNPEYEEQEQNRLKDFINGSIAEGGQIRQRQDIKEEDDALGMAFKGFMTQASQRGEMPDAATFDERWRKNNSPAREFLANFFTGFSDSMAGRQFRAVKEKAFVQERAVVEEKQREQQIKQQYAQQMAGVLQREIEGRRDTQMKQEFAALKDQQTRETSAMKTQLDWLKFAQTHKLNQDKFNALNSQFEWKKQQEEMETSDPYLKQGLMKARAEFEKAGKDPDDPRYKDALLSAAVDYSHGEFAFREKTKADNRPAKAPGTPPDIKAAKDLMPNKVTVTNGWGEQEYGYQSPIQAIKTGNPWLNKPDWWQEQGVRDFSVGEQTQMMKTQQAVDTVRMSLHTLAKNPNATGLKQLLPMSVQGYLRDIKPSERSLVQLFNMGISKYFLGESGVAISGHEEQRLGKGLAPFWDKPENFFVGAMTFASAQEAMLARSRAGIDPNELDMADVVDDYLTWAQKELKEGRKPVIPSGQKMMEMAAGKKKMELVYDNKGRIRGIKR